MNEENLFQENLESPAPQESTPPNLNALKAEIQKEIQTELQTQIKETVQPEIDAATSPLGSVTGYIAIAALALAIIIILVLNFGLTDKINKFIDRFNKHTEEINKEISKLQEEIKFLKGENFELRSRLENLEDKAAPAYNSTPNLQKSPAPALQIKTPPPPPVPTLLDKCKDFISEFNALNNLSGYDKKSAQKNFIAKYNVKFFSCVNFNERMNNPNLEPEFEQQSGKGDYWAYEVESDTFAVMPNVSSYNENCHVARAMGEVFDSNFQDGNYSNIRVVKPAIFKGMWRLSEKGELVLS